MTNGVNAILSSLAPGSVEVVEDYENIGSNLARFRDVSTLEHLSELPAIDGLIPTRLNGRIEVAILA